MNFIYLFILFCFMVIEIQSMPIHTSENNPLYGIGRFCIFEASVIGMNCFTLVQIDKTGTQILEYICHC